MDLVDTVAKPNDTLGIYWVRYSYTSSMVLNADIPEYQQKEYKWLSVVALNKISANDKAKIFISDLHGTDPDAEIDIPYVEFRGPLTQCYEGSGFLCWDERED